MALNLCRVQADKRKDWREKLLFSQSQTMLSFYNYMIILEALLIFVLLQSGQKHWPHQHSWLGGKLDNH